MKLHSRRPQTIFSSFARHIIKTQRKLFSSFIIRDYHPSEIQRIQKLFRTVHLSKWQDSYVADEDRLFVRRINDIWIEEQTELVQPEEFLRIFQLPNRFWVCESNQELVGCIAVEPSNEDGYISRVVVSKEYRGRGMALSLVRTAMQYCIDLKVDTVTMESDEFQVAANTLYRKLGFTNIEKKQYSVDCPEHGKMEYIENVWRLQMKDVEHIYPWVWEK